MSGSGGGTNAAWAIRRGMDVFLWHGGYLGSVVRVELGDSGTGSNGAGAETSTGAARHSPELQHEEGGAVHPTARMGTRMLGEEMGPVPTIALGNTGPDRQSAASDYAADAPAGIRNIRWFAVRPGRLNLGPLTPPLYIPASAVRSISLERIILGVEQVPEEWRAPAAT